MVQRLSAVQVLVAIDGRFATSTSPDELVTICQQWADLIQTSKLSALASSEGTGGGASLVRRAGQVLGSYMQGSAHALLGHLRKACHQVPGEPAVLTDAHAEEEKSITQVLCQVPHAVCVQPHPILD